MSSESEQKPGEGPPAEVPTPTPPSSEPKPPEEPVELVLAQPAGAEPKLAESFTAKHAAGGSLSIDDFILLNEEIAGMARAGLPLDQGLSSMAREMGNGRLRVMMNQVADDLHNGLTLPEAIARQSGRVPAYYPKLLAAGIRTGRMGEVISTLSAYARTMADVRTMIINALVYPLVVLALAFLLFGFMDLILVPKFEEIFSSFRLALPGITIFVFDIHRHALLFFVLIPGSILGGLFLLRILAKSNPEWWRVWARFWYNVPVMGEVLRSARLASFCDLLGILVDNGVPLPEGFLLAGQSSSDPLTALGAKQVHDGLSQGIPLGTVLRTQALMPAMVVWMVGLGEKRGTLGPTLHQVAEMYRRRMEMRIGLMRNLFPSFLIVFVVGTLVSIHVIAMFAPLISLIESFSGGGK